MSWRIKILLGLIAIVSVVLLLPLGRVPAGDIIVPADECIVPPEDLPGTKPPCKPSAVTPCSALTVTKVKVPTMLVNSRRIRLNYSISEVGPSGVSRVELWATRDGNTWTRYSNEPPPSGPLVIQVAEEGKYGFHLVVKSGVGMCSKAPQAGDAPQLWVEVDETKPDVRVTECHVGQGNEAGCLVVGWSAGDVNLMARPITISTSVSPDGPWTPVASSLDNTGKHVWQMPKDVPYQFFVRVEAADKAGNVGHDSTPRPVKVDLSRPKGAILGVDAEKPSEPAKPPTPPHVFNFVPHDL
jgi:hypothetical protein